VSLLFLVLSAGVRADDVERCKAAVRQNPDSVEAICDLANAYTDRYIQMGKRDQKTANIALKVALEARKLNRDSALPQLAMARIYEAQGKQGKAMERALWAIHLEPQHPDVVRIRDRYDISDQDAEFFYAFDEDSVFEGAKGPLSFDPQRLQELLTADNWPLLVGVGVVILFVLGGLFFILKIIKLIFSILFFPFKLIFGFGKKKEKEKEKA
jgi:tetratricopeptide (TPR) repeat protein